MFYKKETIIDALSSNLNYSHHISLFTHPFMKYWLISYANH